MPPPQADDDADAEHEVDVEDLLRLHGWAEQLTRSRAFQDFARRNQQQWASLFGQSATFQKLVSRNQQQWAKLARSFDVPTSEPLLLAKVAEAFQPSAQQWEALSRIVDSFWTDLLQHKPTTWRNLSGNLNTDAWKILAASLDTDPPTADQLGAVGSMIDAGEINVSALDEVDQQLTRQPDLNATIDAASTELTRAFKSLPRPIARQLVVAWVYIMTVMAIVYVTVAFPVPGIFLAASGRGAPEVAKAAGHAFDKIFPDEERPDGGVPER